MSLFDTAMDWIDAASNFLGGGSSGSNERDYDRSHTSSSSSTVTHYRPDDIEVEKLQNERIHLAKEAQLEVMEKKARLEAVMIEASYRGYHAMQQAMMAMLKDVDALAHQRQALLENGSSEQIKKVEAMYADIKKDIQNDDFMSVKIKPLIDLANQFPTDSASYKMFMSGIEQEIAVYIESKANQLKKVEERSDTVVKSVIASRERMQAHVDTVIAKGIEHLGQTLQSNNPQLDFNGTNFQLDAPKQSSANEPLKIEHWEK